MSDSTFKKVLSVLIAIITVIATGVAFLQSNAGNRDDRAGRDATRLAIELVGRRINGEARVNFDYDEAYQKYLEMNALAVAAANHGDELSSERYEILAESFTKLSPIMQPPYFNAEEGTVDRAQYIADVYLTDVTRMNEQYTAAAAVKDAWDTKANTYIVHLTILAVALFLLGLAATIDIRAPRLIFTVVGLAMAGVASLWALSTYSAPVFDLRDQPETIEAYVQGLILATLDQNNEAIEAFNRAIATVPDYAAAYVGRSVVYASTGDLEAAIADLKQARNLGISTANVIGEQAWLEYLLGHFDELIATGREGIDQYPDAPELWIRFDMALALLAKGETDAAIAEYEQGMNIAIAAVAEAQSQNVQISSGLWYSLIAGADDVFALQTATESGDGAPPASALPNTEAIIAAAPDLIDRLRNLAVSLEFYGRPPGDPITAEIESLAFAEPLYSDDGEFLEHYVAEEFEYGTNEMDAMFDFSGMRDGQELLVKVYINGEEDASWRKLVTWDAGADGSYIIPLAIAYSDTFQFAPGIYFVEIYIDGQIAAEGSFEVLEPEE